MSQTETNFISKYADYASTQTDAPKVFHAYVGMTIAGAALGNRVLIPSWGDEITPAIWTILLAPSGFYHKSTAIRIGQRILNKADDTLMMPDEFSPEKLIGRLAKNAQGIFVASEFGNMLGMLKRDYMAGARELITDFFDSPESYQRTTGKDGAVTIKRPALSFLAATTLDWLQERMSTRDMRGGLFARFLFVVGREKNGSIYEPPPRDLLVENDLVYHLRELADVGKERPRQVDLDVVMPMFRSWQQAYEEDINRRQPSSDLMGVFNRTTVYVLKIATIAHYAHTTESDTLCPRDFEFATQMVLASQTEVMRVWEEDMTHGEDDQAMRRVLDIITRAGEVGIGRSGLVRASRLIAKKLDLYLDTLVQSNQVAMDRVGTTGRPETRYRVQQSNGHSQNGYGGVVVSLLSRERRGETAPAEASFT